ncbi:HINT3.2 family protein [Megaselia abdita]
MGICVFCDIVSGKCPDTVIEYQNEELVIFKDIKPRADFHFLAIPKVHHESILTLNQKEHSSLIDNLEKSLRDLLEWKNIDVDEAVFGFHVPPFISVWHLHLHALAPVSSIYPGCRYKYIPGDFFKTPDRAKEMLPYSVKGHLKVVLSKTL